MKHLIFIMMIVVLDYTGIMWNPCFSNTCFFIQCIAQQNCQTDPETYLAQTEADANALLNRYGLTRLRGVYRVQWDTQTMTSTITAIPVRSQLFLGK